MVDIAKIYFTFILICMIMPVWANLKRCSEISNTPEICLNGTEDYFDPFPVSIGSDFYLKEVAHIDEEKNSISIQVELWTYWHDPLLALSKISEM